MGAAVRCYHGKQLPPLLVFFEQFQAIDMLFYFHACPHQHIGNVRVSEFVQAGFAVWHYFALPLSDKRHGAQPEPLKNGPAGHTCFAEILQLLPDGDLVRNDKARTRILPYKFCHVSP